MVSVNPFAEFREECETILRDALDRLYPQISITQIMLESPPSLEFGELASSLCFELSKETETTPIEIAERVVECIDSSQFALIQSLGAAGKGYINFYANLPEFTKLTLESIRALDTKYGYVKAEESRKIIVEHTSVNPNAPIHIGQARNPILGDALASILKKRGHKVFRHYYIDDVGRQAAVAAYGYEKLGKPKPEGKPDHYIGKIYTITSCITEIDRLKKEIRQREEQGATEEASKLQLELDDWTSVAAELNKRFPELFSRLLKAIQEDENPDLRMNDLVRGYEGGREEAKSLIREVCQVCVDGLKSTLDRVGISFDSWDWESSFAWSSDVKRVLERLEKTPYVFRVGGVLEFDAERVVHDLDLREKLGLREEYEVPSLTLVRANGTTLYTTRDVAYSLWKFERVEKVINVVGMEQALAQLQLKLALYALGQNNQAGNLVHFSYNLVSLPGYRMSSRTGRYITLDEVVGEALQRAHDEVSRRSPHLSDAEKRRISKLVGIGALKYALVEVDTSKPVVFTWDRVLDFEKNSAPYIQYSHARACSILRKASRKPENPDYALLKDDLERDLTLMLARFPMVFIDAAENLRPSEIANFANTLADKFNKFYAALPVIKAKPKRLGDGRLVLVKTTRNVLRNALSLLGIEAPERM
ncbi:MAG: arginine--tRNA ligase [Candidatus Bathyarchaeota archaeon]|nr:MAG: arginine--tRNA ligase [Candidatus Bathyarchaeota archaeon]